LVRPSAGYSNGQVEELTPCSANQQGVAVSDQHAGAEGLTDEEIAPDPGPAPLGEPSEASDPDIRNTTRGQDDGQDPVDQADPAQEMERQEPDETQAGPRTSPTD
jgi:hypothetical protein